MMCQNGVPVAPAARLSRAREVSGQVRQLREVLRLVEVARAPLPYVDLLQRDHVRPKAVDHVGHTTRLTAAVRTDTAADVVSHDA